MSTSVGIKTVQEIIDPATITNWYQAGSLNLNHGDLVGNFPDNSGNGVHLIQNSSASKPTFEIDSKGFKCVHFYSGNSMISTVTKPYNVDETFIAICKVNNIPSGSLRFIFRQFGGYNRVYLQANAALAEATDYVPGSGKIGLTMATTLTDEDRMAVTTQRRASIDPVLKIWDKKKYVTGTFTNTSYAASAAWNIVSSTWEVSVYEILVVNEFLSDEKVMKLVRSIGFRNGLRI